jgi:hypothetical protein
MILRTILAGLSLSAATSWLHAAEPKEPKQTADKSAEKADGKKEKGKPAKPPAHVCALNITWWEEPTLKEGETLELGIQDGKDFKPIAIQAMTIGHPIEYTGGPNVVIARKTKVASVDKKGKPITSDEWVPFANFTITEAETDVLALLMPASNSPTAVVKTFDIGVESFPYGSINLLNYTKAKIGCSVDGAFFFAGPGQRGRLAKPIASRRVVNFKLAVVEADGGLRPLVSSPMVLDQRSRRLYFVVEVPGATEDARFRVNGLVDHVEDHAPPKPEEEVAPTKKADVKEPKKSAEKQPAATK